MTTAPKPFVFVLMPFSKEFDDTYELAIQPACEAAGAYAERVDKQIFTGSILDRVYNQISKADLIVADMSERNPNVFYEVGYAHALGKKTILVTRTVEDIPFDLKHYPHIIYKDRLAELRRELEARVNWHLNNPARLQAEADNLFIRVNGISLDGSNVVPAKVRKVNSGFSLNVEIQNKVRKSIEVAKFQIGFLSSRDFWRTNILGEPPDLVVDVDDQNRLNLCSASFSILPEAWCSIRFHPTTINREVVGGEIHNFCIRIYRESGAQDYPFVVQTEKY